MFSLINDLFITVAVFNTMPVFIQMLDHFWDWCPLPLIQVNELSIEENSSIVPTPVLPKAYNTMEVVSITKWLADKNVRNIVAQIMKHLLCFNFITTSIHKKVTYINLYPTLFGITLIFVVFNFRVTSIPLTYRLFIQAIIFSVMFTTTNTIVAR